MQERQVLINRAANVAKANPGEWKEFIRALAAYVEVQRNNVVQSPLPDLPVNQGRAQFGTALVLLLDNCVRDDDAQKQGART